MKTAELLLEITSFSIYTHNDNNTLPESEHHGEERSHLKVCISMFTPSVSLLNTKIFTL
jgi:hypothetical protein